MSAIVTLCQTVPRYAALLRSQYWLPATLESYRARQLQKTLAAAAKIPFYAERIGTSPHAGDLRRLPMLKRADIATLTASVRSRYPSGTHLIGERSSATSGDAVQLLFDESHQRGRNAARARYLRAHGWNPLARSVWFGAARLLVEHDPDYLTAAELVRGFASLGVRFFATSTPFAEQADIVARYRAVSVYGFPSGIDGIARVLEETGARLPSLRLALCGGEVVDDSMRERARRVFGLEVRDNYGSTEAFLAFQCRQGSYHINAEHVLIEIVDDGGREVAPGETGKVLVTTLENYLMPLIRYEIGDYAIAASGGCACGRTLPLLGPVMGRQVNMLRTQEGKLVTGWEAITILRKFPEMKIFQTVQKSIGQLCVRYVASRPLALEAERQITKAFRDYLGAATSVAFEQVDEIERAPSGKFMVTLSEVPP